MSAGKYIFKWSYRFRIIKFDQVGSGGSGKIKICPRDNLILALEPSGVYQMGKGPLQWTQSGPPPLPLTDLSPFPGSLTHLGAPGRFFIQTKSISHADFDLPTQSNFYRPKWLVQMSHTQCDIFCVQLEPIGVILGPLKSVLATFRPF